MRKYKDFKFRLWDKDLKEMHTYHDAEDVFSYPKRGTHEYVIMQYTGLKDRKGREIFEGDKVKQVIKGIKPMKRKIKPGEMWGFDPAKGIPDKTLIEEVKVDSRYGTSPFNDDMSYSDPDKWEIIGNKYEEKTNQKTKIAKTS